MVKVISKANCTKCEKRNETNAPHPSPLKQVNRKCTKRACSVVNVPHCMPVLKLALLCAWEEHTKDTWEQHTGNSIPRGEGKVVPSLDWFSRDTTHKIRDESANSKQKKKTKKHTTSNNAIGRSVCLSNAFKSSREQSHRRIWVELSDLQKINCNGMMVDAHGWITWYRVRTTAVLTNGCDGQNASLKSESYLRLRLNLLWWGSRRELSLQLHLLSCQP